VLLSLDLGIGVDVQERQQLIFDRQVNQTGLRVLQLGAAITEMHDASINSG
jgi:hypothetical protein